jgi:hypothetical protein
LVADSHHFDENPDPEQDPDPHNIEKLDPDPISMNSLTRIRNFGQKKPE